jgi:putative transposase
VLLDVVLGQRERFEDWLEMGRGLVRRGLRAPMLVVTDGAPGLIRAMEEMWPDSDRQRCTVHVLRNLVAKLPKKDAELHQRVEAAYWAALLPGRRPAGRSEFTSRTRSGCASGCARRTCWSGRWRRSSGGPR